MSAPLPAELHEERLQEAVDAARARTYERVGREALTWLALVPEWTLELAEACSFPEKVADFTERAHAAGLCEIRRRRGAPVNFWMPATAREDFMRDARARGRTELAETAGVIADRILAVEGKVRVAATIRHWAEIAQLGSAGALRGGDELGRRIQETTGRRDAAGALDWIAAGEGLAQVLGGDIGAVVARGRRRVNLEYRRRHDERALQHFLRRHEQVELLRQLILESGRAWALHFIGMGGVGKTMLMRYLGTGFAADHGGTAFPVGRVDFDHIDPRYPWERPEQLLVELAEALSAYVETAEQESALDGFIELVRRSDEARGSATGLAQLAEGPFLAALEGFARFAETLPQPVVLVLDTCEELAKLHPGDASVPSVDATFTILEHLHEALPTTRVVLAGRRLLATAGAGGWTVDNVQPASLTSLRPRPYLLLHEVRGFDRDEALELFAVRGLRVEEDALEVVLGASLETGRVPGVPGGRQGVAGDRYNPFDLDLYGDWLAEEGELPLAQIASGDSDAYVRLRIAERLNEPGLERALPGAALLGRFDLAAIEPLLPDSPSEHERLMRAFAEQEWIDIASGDEPASMVLEIEPHLLPRLRAYYAGTPELDEAVDALGRQLEHVLLHDDLGALAIDHADTALRMRDPAGAARLWEMLELRIAADARWDWALSACLRLLAVDEDTGEPRHVPLRAAIRATYQAARRHHPAEYGPNPEGWREVLAAIDDHPVEEMRERLVERARLGAWGDAAEAGEPFEAPDGLRWRQLLREPLESDHRTASIVAALERIMDSSVAQDAVEKIGSLAILRWGELVRSSDGPRELRGAAAVLAARARVLAGGRLDEIAEPDAGVDGDRHRFIDWVAPATPSSRVRLEWFLLQCRLWDGGAQPRAPGGAGRRETVDHARLASARVVTALAVRASPTIVETVPRAPEPGREPAFECAAHRSVPPLFAARARALLAVGRAEEALDLLRRHEEAAVATRGADRAQHAAGWDARLELLAMLRRLRLSGGYASLLQSAAGRPLWTGEIFAQREAGAVATALILDDGLTAADRGREPESALEAHLAWRAGSRCPRPADVARAMGADDPVLTAHLKLDQCEARLLDEGDGFAGLDPGELDALWAHARDRERRGLSALPPFEAEWVRIVLRAWALSSAYLTPLDDRLLRLPARRLAEIALEEGELVALRLPGRAMPLLEIAIDRYESVDDGLGAFCAHVTAALAAFRADLEDAGRSLVDDLQRIYPPIAERLDLPEWKAVRPVESVWDGWLLRLQVAQDWAAGREGPSNGPAEVQRGVGDYVDYTPPDRSPPTPQPAPAAGEAAGPQVAPPPREYAPDMPPPAPVAPIVCPTCGRQAAPSEDFCKLCGEYLHWERDDDVRRAAAPETPRVYASPAPFSPVSPMRVGPERRRSVWPPLIGAAVLAIAAAVVLTALGGGAEPVSSPSGGSTGSDLLEIALLVVGAVVVLALVARAVANSLSHRPFRTWRCVVYQPADDGTVGVEVQGRRGSAYSLKVELTEPGDPDVPEIRRFLRRRRRPLPLVVESGEAEAGWEAALLVEPGAQALPRADVWRFTPQQQRISVPPLEPLVGGLASERWLLLIENMWPARRVRLGGLALVESGGIVHLIGLPARTVAGWRLRLDDERLAGSDAGNVTRSADAAEELIAPRAIATSPGPGLTIVQGSPGPLNAETAAGLRGCAAALFEAGVPSVLTIPPLPVDVVGPVGQAFSAALPPNAIAPDDLLKASRALRQAIVRALGGGPDAVRVALDVCLYGPQRK